MQSRLFPYIGMTIGGSILGFLTAATFKDATAQPEKKNNTQNSIDSNEYKNLMKEYDGMKIEPVSQHKFSNREGYNGGICFGLSSMHILQQLQSTSGPRNPFKAFYTVDDSFKFQTKNNHRETMLDRARVEHVIKPIDGELEDALNKTIHATAEDGIGRGTVIIGNKSNRYSTPEMKTGHAVSMTVQKNNGKLSCTGLDPNFFFAKAGEEKGCHAIAKKLQEAAKLYDFDKNELEILDIKKRY